MFKIFLLEEIFAFRLMNYREKIIYKKNLSLNNDCMPIIYHLESDVHRFNLYGIKNEVDEIKKVLEKEITKEYLKTTDYNIRYMSVLREKKALKRFR